MKIAKVYALIDPRNSHIRYIGGTVRTLEGRLKEHISKARKEPHNNLYSSRWIRSLLKLNLHPIIKLIWVCEGEFYKDEEIFWIAFFRMNGCNLTNLTEGGEGTLGYKHTEEAKERMSLSHLGNKALLGYRHSEISLLKMSAAAKGKKQPTAQIEANRLWHTGKKHSQETKDRISSSIKKRLAQKSQ